MNTTLEQAGETDRRTEIRVEQLRQGKFEILLGKMKVGDLNAYTTIDHYDSAIEKDSADQGYQRRPMDSKIKVFGNWLAGTGNDGEFPLMPTALLLSRRGDPLVVSGSGTVPIDSEDKLYLVDGQHRTAAYKYAIRVRGKEELSHFEVPIIIMNGLSKEEEMEQFQIVNGKAKSVPTDLVNMLLAIRAESDPDGIDKKDLWKVIANNTAEALNKDPQCALHGAILMPNELAPTRAQIEESPQLEKTKLVKMTSLQVSVKPLINPPGDSLLDTWFFERKWGTGERVECMAKILSAYWGALKTVLPECFAQPRNFVLLKTPGIFSLHILLKEILRDLARDRVEIDNFESEILTRIEGMPSLNPAFWAVGGDEDFPERGPAASYGSMKGFSLLGEVLALDYEDTAAV